MTNQEIIALRDKQANELWKYATEIMGLERSEALTSLMVAIAQGLCEVRSPSARIAAAFVLTKILAIKGKL